MFKKKLVLASTLVLGIFASSEAQAEIWMPRDLGAIRQEVVKTDTEMTYVVKYGDTLSSIALAMNVDLHLLAQVNQIANLDLIFPDTVLKVTYNAQQEAETIAIATPAAASQEAVSATVDVVNQEVSVAGETQPLPEVTTVQTETSLAETTLAPETTVASESTVQTETTIAPETTEASVAPETTEATVLTEASQTTEVSLAEETTAPTETTQAVETTELPTETTIITETETSASTALTPAAEVTEAVIETTAAPETTTAAPVTESVTTAVDLYANPENAGLQPHVAAYKEEVAAIFGITSFSTYRPGDAEDHGKGLAVDFMVPVSSALGDQVAQYAVDNMAAKNISYIIWKQRFYSPFPSIYGPAYTWNLMPDRGSVTQNHYDHVHVSFNP